MKLFRKCVPALAVGLGVLLGAPQGALATGAGTGAFAGQGTISPGLDVGSTAQTVRWDATSLSAFAIDAGSGQLDQPSAVLTCSFSGSGSQNLSGGHVSGMLMCTSTVATHIKFPGGGASTNATLSITCDVFAYDQLGPVIVWAAVSCTVSASSGFSFTTTVANLSGAALFVPNGVPVRSFELTGAFVATP